MTDFQFNFFVYTMWVFFVAALIGWILNIIKFVGMLGGEVTTMFLVRIVGIFFAPLGGVLGFI